MTTKSYNHRQQRNPWHREEGTWHHEKGILNANIHIRGLFKYECKWLHNFLHIYANRFYIGLYVTFKVTPDLKKNTVYLPSYSPLNEGHMCILTNSMLRTYTVIETSVYFFVEQVKFLEIFKEVSPYSYIMIL